MPPENPFVFDRPLEAQRDLLGRDEQLAEVIGAARAGRDVLVVGPYRHGKTSLLNIALGELAAEDGALGVRVDCAGVLTADDFVRRVEDACSRAWAAGEAEDTLAERLEALSFVGGATAAAGLDALLELPGEVVDRTGGRAVIAFDEFQDGLALPDVVQAIKESGRTGRVVHVFAAPELASYESVPWPKRTPTVILEAIDPTAIANYITERFKATERDAGEAAKVLAIVGAGHPQRTNLLAAQLWELTAQGERATVDKARAAIERAVVRCTPEFEARWQALHGNERRVAVAIANELAPQGTRAQRATGLAGFGAAQRAVRGIVSSGVAEARDDHVVLTDPLFAEWLRDRHRQAPREPGWQALRRRAELERGTSRRITP